MELEQVFEYSKNKLDEEHKAREKGLTLSRECIRNCANSIRAAHRGDDEKSVELKTKAKEALVEAQNALLPYPRIYYAGFLQDAEKEYAEASATFAMIKEQDIPMPDEIGVDVAPYLNGLGEAAGEMRRHALDLMSAGNLDRSKEILSKMDDIYYLLASVDYPTAITGGLKRTNDMVRGVLERTRGDYISATRQESLEQKMKELRDKL
ncbi:MAG: haloacid dehalogenase [Actinobacteria bacterium]|nr:haloacid dehalogenase [Actinomycetota bacterium]